MTGPRAGGGAGDSPLAPFLDGHARRARFSVRPAPPAPLPVVDRLLAGAAEVDITPPPGMPKAGYSANATDGNGFRTRLRARVLHLRSGSAALAWVQCDLLGGSSVLQHLVADRIAAATDVPLAGLMIGATHTHAGPGQFLGSDFYNRFASNRGGFDPAYTEFLVGRIADAVIEAVAGRAPARLATGRAPVWGLTRNRSLDPHVENESVADKRTAPQRKYVAVNPWLHLVRVDTEVPAGAHEPLAAVVVFSVHGTGISQRAPEYNADLWAYLVGELGHRIEVATGRRPVVGAVEGTHADVAPAVRPGLAGHLEAERVGRGIGAEAAALYARLGDSLTERVELGVALREVDLERHEAVDAVSLPHRPAVGAALVAGAHENVTPVLHRIPPFRRGTPKRWGAGGPQGEKWVLGSRWLQPLILPLRSFPRLLPLQVLRIGGLAVVGLPFEITVEAGRRVEAAVLGALGPLGVGTVAVSSVANEYSGYIATAEEYRLQHYEGGHTLYGPQTQRFITAHAHRLAADLAREGVVSDVSGERRWDLRVHRYLPVAPERGPIVPRRVAEAEYVDPTRVENGYWQAEWVDVAPGGLTWHAPLVRVEASGPDGAWHPAVRGGVPVDDQGWSLEVSHLGPDPTHEGTHRYRVRWYDPAFAAESRHRFVLVANHGRPEVSSPPFD